MPLGVNPYDEARIQERNAADANIANIVSPGLITDGAVLQLDAGNFSSFSGSGQWRSLIGTNHYTVSATWNSAGYFTFNGTSHDATSTSSITFPGINDINFCATGWFRTNSASGRKMFGFENANTGTGATSYDKHLYVSSTGNLVWGVWNGAINMATTSGTYANNTWYHFGVVYNRSASSSTLYVNGANVASLSGVSGDSGTFLRIASYRCSTWTNAGDGYFPGDISDFTFYTNTILTPDQIAQNYNATRARFGV